MKPGMYSVTHENVITVPIWAELGIIPGRTKNQLDCRICHCALKETNKTSKILLGTPAASSYSDARIIVFKLISALLTSLVVKP